MKPCFTYFFKFYFSSKVMGLQTSHVENGNLYLITRASGRSAALWHTLASSVTALTDASAEQWAFPSEDFIRSVTGLLDPPHGDSVEEMQPTPPSVLAALGQPSPLAYLAQTLAFIPDRLKKWLDFFSVPASLGRGRDRFLYAQYPHFRGQVWPLTTWQESNSGVTRIKKEDT